MAERRKLHRGDRVSWRSHGSTARGTVQEEITERTYAGKRTAATSKENPRYRVRTDEGRDAVHRPEVLHGE
ncbi:DUF2945 domain-containing protein [Plantactinospora sp. S1510]|uniref:DUF2945 domain-containing protein n=1 Tax=Plantactinospora alkalitolerans TaxID=2789879 RepID=A0ABS0H6C8_9ACTN|nr:DUF2945 domain-containing protein [Plantactinospora alkalitolerans]MBF9134013.1 DUF2945 domain-containing protein [Plantactinospora alkalitolerans]